MFPELKEEMIFKIGGNSGSKKEVDPYWTVFFVFFISDHKNQEIDSLDVAFLSVEWEFSDVKYAACLLCECIWEYDEWTEETTAASLCIPTTALDHNRTVPGFLTRYTATT